MVEIANLTTRNMQPELMDDPDLCPSVHRAALDGLTRIHRVTRSTQRFWKTIRAKFASKGDRLTVLDVGCGDAFLLRSLARLAHRDSIELKLVGCDISPVALQLARKHATEEHVSLETVEFDVLSADLLMPADVVISSLFMHHFETDQVIRILQKMNLAARRGVVIEDLRRTRLGYALCWLGTRTLTRSPVVHTDGLLSVAAAFSDNEFSNLLHQAGVSQPDLTKQWPERFMVSWCCDKEAA